MVEILCRFHASGTRGGSKKDFPENDDDNPKNPSKDEPNCSPEHSLGAILCFIMYIAGSLSAIIVLFIITMAYSSNYRQLENVISMTSASCQAEIRNITDVLYPYSPMQAG